MTQYENAFGLKQLAGIPYPLHGILLLRDRFDGDTGNDPALDQAEQFVDSCLAAFAMTEDFLSNTGIQAGKKVDGQFSGFHKPENRLLPLGKT